MILYKKVLTIFKIIFIKKLKFIFIDIYLFNNKFQKKINKEMYQFRQQPISQLISQDSKELETNITNTNNYDIKITDYDTYIKCSLYLNNTNYESIIEQINLKSGIVSLLKLKNILKLNSSKTQPNYVINFESGTNDRNDRKDW